MPIDEDAIIEALREMRSKTKKRDFKQSVELLVNLRDIDLKKPENRIRELVELPHGLGKEARVCVIASGDAALRAKKAGLDVLDKEELESMAGDKKRAKKLAKQYDYFVAEAPLMPLIGRILGAVLGPRGKMPTPVPPTADFKAVVDRLKKTVRVVAWKAPNVYCKVGTEDMDDKALAENINAVIKVLEEKLPRGLRNIKSVYIKMSMGPAVEVKLK
ncbi:50S ribosomal protein L1 [Candidatus Bathyarchaeota archaeon ex4484_135]|nr:MAG: 50S ribosomal protein L1 [Candidatus Bathyarchaeota archaeon ex4484_135]